MSYWEGVSRGCATGFSIYRPTIKLPLDELLGEEYDGKDDQMADAPIEQLDDMKEDGNGNSNNVPTQPEGESLLGGSASAEQDVLMSDSHQQQQPQPSTPDLFPVPQPSGYAALETTQPNHGKSRVPDVAEAQQCDTISILGGGGGAQIIFVQIQQHIVLVLCITAI
ncbi:uncharacterized protein F5147DRAFT_648166 [Suillus discolor]|uniref:Uncharacterized protein n=1 Tax=Suillus discolor TaxID=1912936 RepID=A0A9P7JZN9_9AGAM|nr:uncharacterized protein F5147DRAFT_648166 [Suillus discolor]KAG2119104.1 hypothetical protein F5147DRAFT_648166 [Suillus discolor]